MLACSGRVLLASCICAAAVYLCEGTERLRAGWEKGDTVTVCYPINHEKNDGRRHAGELLHRHKSEDENGVKGWQVRFTDILQGVHSAPRWLSSLCCMLRLLFLTSILRRAAAFVFLSLPCYV